jgi:hypothetical protein
MKCAAQGTEILRKDTKMQHVQQSPIIMFSLPGLLDPGHTLALNTHLGVLSYLLTNKGVPNIVAQQHFTPTESAVLLHLLEAYPSYCSYETLFVALAHLNENSKVAQPGLHIVPEQEYWTLFIKPLRHTLSRTRLKARACGLDIAAVNELGYLLHASSDHPLFSHEVSRSYIHRTTTSTKGVASYAH